MKKHFILFVVAFVLIALNLDAQITDTNMVKIYSMSLEELMNTKVSIATKSDQPLSETPSIVSVITAEDIRNTGARELADVLQTIPGFELLKKFDGEYGVGVRGVKDPRCTSKILIMIDGIPYNQILYGYSIDYGYEINMDAIERIEIIRGPGSALYGRNAFSGVINVITKTAKTGEKIMAKGSIGTFNTKSVSGYYGFNNNKINASVSLNKIYTDGTNVKYDDGSGGKGLWSINHDNSSINANLGIGKFNFSGSFYSLNDGGFVDIFKINEKRGYYSLSYENEISPRVSYTARIYGHYLNHVEHYQELKPNIDTAFSMGIYYQPQGKEYSYCAEADLKCKLSSNNDLLIGIQPEFYGVKDVLIYTNFDFNTNAALPGVGRDNLVLFKPGWVSNNGHKYSNTAILLQDIWYLVENISLTLGGRYDFDSEIGGVFNPRAALYWAPDTKTSFKLLYGQAYRAPSPTEQYGTLGFVIGNETLKPERIKTFEFAFTYRLDKMTNSISIFRNQLNNMIYAASKTELDPSNVYKNIGKNNSTGIEYETKLFLGKGFSTYFNYSYTISKNSDNIGSKDTIYNESDVAPHKINCGINYSFLSHFNLNMNVFYRSKMGKLLAPDLAGNLIEVQDPIGNFAILNSTFQVNDIVTNFNISISAYNLLNTKYYSQENQNLHQPPQPGRQVIFSAIYKF